MSNSYYQRRKYPKQRDPDDPFEKLTSFMPTDTAAILTQIADERGVPVSRLIAYAVDNELDLETPFNYPIPKPDTEYVEFAFATDAGKLLRFLQKLKGGAAPDTLLICRRMIGIDKREHVMYAYRELLEQGLIEEFYPKSKNYRGRDYKRVRVIEEDIGRNPVKRYKTFEGSSERVKNSDIERDEE